MKLQTKTTTCSPTQAQRLKLHKESLERAKSYDNLAIEKPSKAELYKKKATQCRANAEHFLTGEWSWI